MSKVDFQHLRLLEAILFASPEPLAERSLAARLPDGADLDALLEELKGRYAEAGVNLVKSGKSWSFHTAPDLGPMLAMKSEAVRRLGRATIETLAVIAYHQPVTRAEIESIRGVGFNKGTLDVLFEAGWIRPRGRRRTPGRPMNWGTTDDFLDHFGLESLADLPGIEDMKAAGLLDTRPSIEAYRVLGDMEGKEPEESAGDGAPEPLDPDDGAPERVNPDDGAPETLGTGGGG